MADVMIARVKSSEPVPSVPRYSQGSARRPPRLPNVPNSELNAESEIIVDEEASFSLLDPTIGAILTLIDREACEHVADKVKQLLAG